MYLGFLGLLAILHGGYSSKEFVQYYKLQGLHPPSTPRDIVVEILIGLLLAILDITFSGISNLRPSSLAQEHAEYESEGYNPYGNLDNRPHFQDYIGRRKAYVDWRRETSSKVAEKSKAAEKKK